MKEILTHLLKPKEYRVWCRPRRVPGHFYVTTRPSACNCANCLTAYRRRIGKGKRGYRGEFKVRYTTGRKLYCEETNE